MFGLSNIFSMEMWLLIGFMCVMFAYLYYVL